MDSELPPLSFADFNSVMLVIIGVCANGAVALITLILVIILAWNYLKLLLEAAERYVLLGVLVYTAPVAFSMGASQTTIEHLEIWCRMLGGQIFLLIMNAWCLRLFTSMVGSFMQSALFVRRGALKRFKKILFLALMVAALSCLFCQPAFAISEEEVQAQVDAVGKETGFRQCPDLVHVCDRLLEGIAENRLVHGKLGVNVGHTAAVCWPRP